MATINYANVIFKDKNGNVGTIKTLSAADIDKLNNAVAVTTTSGLPVYDATKDYEVGFVVRSGTYIYQCLVANGPSSAVHAVTDSTYWAQIGSVADATTSAKGVVQLADATAVAAGTAGRVVDAAQLKDVIDDLEHIYVSETAVVPSSLSEGEGAIIPATDLLS